MHEHKTGQDTTLLTVREASHYQSYVVVLQDTPRAACESSLLCSFPSPKFVARAEPCAGTVTDTASLGAVFGVAHPSSLRAADVCLA